MVRMVILFKTAVQRWFVRRRLTYTVVLLYNCGGNDMLRDMKKVFGYDLVSRNLQCNSLNVCDNEGLETGEHDRGHPGMSSMPQSGKCRSNCKQTTNT